MIEWIITSSALILLVILLRAAIKDRISPRLRYALWGLVLLRLVVPVSLWESPASVLRAAQVNEGYQLASTLPDFMSLYENGSWRTVAGPEDTFRMEPGAPVRWEEGQPRLHNAYGWVAVLSAEEAQALRDQGQKAVDTAGLKRLVDAQNVLRTVWQAGVWLSVLFLAVVNGKFALGLRRRRRPDGEYRGRPVFIMDGLPTPCLFGLFRPAIYLTPEVTADEAARAHVLAHEYAHFRQGDHIWAALRGVCLAVHWYNPLVWLAAYLSRRDCELSCDEGAVRLLGEASRADYGRTLVGLVARRTTPRDLACCATTMTGGKSALKERIALLVKHPRTTAVMAVLVAAACVVFAVCTFTGAKAEEAAGPDEPEEPVQTEQEPQKAELPEGYPSLEELPTRTLDAYTLGDLLENTDPCWLLDQVEGEDIALYGVNPMGKADKVSGIYLRYGEHLQYFDQVAMPYQYILPHLNWYDVDGDGENELLTVYAVMKGTTVDRNELVVYEWEGGRWSEHRYDPAELIEDFNANAEFESEGDMSRITYRGYSTQVALGGDECFLTDYVVGFTHDRESPGILLTLWGEIGPALTSHNYAFCYTCGITYKADGTFVEKRGTLDSFYEPELPPPALEDLPTRVVSPGTPEATEDIWLVAELPEDDIAVYFEQDTGRNWLRYGDVLQEILSGSPLVAMPQMLLPGFWTEDLDGDGKKELAAIYSTGHGTGVARWGLTVFERDGASWTEHTARLEEEIINDFNTNHTLTLHPDENYVTVSFRESTVDVDMDARFNGKTRWKEEPLACEITGAISGYNRESYGLALTLAGELRPESYHPTTSYAFTYTCSVYYDGDSVFHASPGWLDTDYRWTPTVDESLLTPTFRDILRRFIRQCRAEGTEDLSSENFAICDVNGDGKKELITQRNNTYMAGQAEWVYDADGNELLAEYPATTYYDNGYVQAGWSHNQGVAGDKLWPYTLYRYDRSAGKYVPEASVDGWDKNIRDTYLSYDETVIPFPEEIDKDGDGFVYYIITEEGGYAPEYGEAMDNADYEAWRASWLGSAFPTGPDLIPLTAENISLIG